jgi:hypothetical protein
MPKPITYYLSQKYQFDWDQIARLNAPERVALGRDLLNLACPVPMSPIEVMELSQSIADRMLVFKVIIDRLTWRQKLEIAAAILMVTCDELHDQDMTVPF